MPVLVPLAADDGFGGILAQLVFVLLMVAAWVFRRIVERARRLGTGVAQPKVREPAQAPATQAPSRPDVVYGSRPLAHPPRTDRTGRVDAPGRPSAHEIERPSREVSTRDAGGRARVQTLIEQIGTSAPTLSLRDRRPPGGRSLLGIGRDLSAREATRRGILWSEILGPPRALRGPHRHRFP